MYMRKWQAPSNRKLDAPQTRSGPFGEEKSNLLPTGVELRFFGRPARILLTDLNELPLPIFIKMEWLKTQLPEGAERVFIGFSVGGPRWSPAERLLNGLEETP
jgi:hypothetical protein